MRIGIIAPYNILSLTSGAPIRVFNLAQEFSNQGVSVFILHCGPTTNLSKKLKLFHFKPLSVYQGINNYFHPINVFYPKRLSEFLYRYKIDVVQCEQPWSYFPTFFFTKKFHVPCVLDCHNVEFDWVLNSSKFPILTPYTFIMEKFAILNSSYTLAVSKLDKDRLSHIYKVPNEKIFITPNGVDLSRFSSKPSNLIMKKKLGFNSNNKIILFHGLLSAKQNNEAAKLIIDYIAPMIKEAKFLIIGKNAPSWLRIRARLQENVLLLGYVPRIEDFISAADLCIVPLLRGSGTKLKLLEYIAAGKPIVSTFKAIEGLEMVNKIHGLFYKKIDTNLIDGIRLVLNNDQLAKDLGQNARTLSHMYDWSLIVEKLYKAYLNLLSKDNQ